MSAWVQHAPGWFTLRTVGGIGHERGGWTFWPRAGGAPTRGIPTLAAAKRVAILRAVYPDSLGDKA